VGPAGGRIIYIDTTNQFPWTYLECAPADAGTAPWGPLNSFVGGTGIATGTAIGTGQANTAAILNKFGQEGAAARLCDNYYTYTARLYDDWFLPSKDELNLLYTELKLYSMGGFSSDAVYWSSSENDHSKVGSSAWRQWFSDGGQYEYYLKTNPYSVRAVRAF
jgi:hypothetical protein